MASVTADFLSDERLEAVREELARTRRPLSDLLVDVGGVDPERLPDVLARLRGLEVVDLQSYPIDPTAAAIVPYKIARRHCVVPIDWDQDNVVVAVSDPLNVVLVDDLRIVTRRNVKLVVAAAADIEDAVSRVYAIDGAEIAQLSDDEPPAADEVDLHVNDAPAVRVVNQIVADAVRKRASDVHLEPEERDLRVRYRIDGVLHDVARLPKSHQPGIISRVKVMADANIAERRLPQDGRISLVADGRQVDLRLATLPSVWGEEVVVRILDRSSSLLSLEDLGYSEHAQARYETALGRGHGLILVTGPTGSGKSTTLYATLNRLNDPSKKVVTVEDPVEYRMAGLRQIQVHPEIGLTFARALRSILRSDPDTVMVGEIRDRETAAIAIQAAMTGHVVLATLHTNDAPSAVTRLIDMGVEAFLVASALNCVMAQRLVRRLCDRCAEAGPPSGPAASPVLWRGPVPETVRAAVGCRECAGTGFRGRIAIAEVMPVGEEIARLTAERRSTHEIAAVAIEQGMRTIVEDGLSKATSGTTSVDEVLRVVS